MIIIDKTLVRGSPRKIKIGDKIYRKYPGVPEPFRKKVGAVLFCKSEREFTGRSCRAVKFNDKYYAYTTWRLM